MLAPAELDGFGLGGLVFQRLDAASRVAAIAEGLAGASAAGAPVVAFASFNGHGIGTFLGNLRFRHGEFSLNCTTAIIADPVESRHPFAGTWFWAATFESVEKRDDPQVVTSNAFIAFSDLL
jgi:hypothetical protein